jgi:hypothetical protein
MKQLARIIIAAFTVSVMALSGLSALAQDAETGETTSYDSFNTYIPRAQERYNVFVFGDTLAEGLAAGLKRLVRGNEQYQVLPRGRSGTGLARPDKYDWNAAVARIIDGQRIDIAIILIGSNDTSNLSTAEARYNIGSELWREAYAGYVDQLIDQLRANGTAVYWVELPPMAREDYDQSIQLVTEVQRERVYQAEVRYVSIRQQFTDADGAYTDRGTALDGEDRRLRSRDGIHFIRRGNDKLASFALAMIERDVEDVESGGLTAFDEVVGGTATEVRATVPNIPIFGQESETGAALRVEFGPEITLVSREGDGETDATGLNVTLRDGSSGNVVVAGSGGSEQFSPRVTPGSVAAQVLLDGMAIDAKSGRADDFSWPRTN